VDLDGAPWRVAPADAVVRAGLGVGLALDRPAARALARELRKAAALGIATSALRHRDLTRRGLEERLVRRGASPRARAEALDVLERAGLVDDRRVATARAHALAARGYGDAAIRASLDRDGVEPSAAETAVAELEPEGDRARRLVERRGPGPRTYRWLAGRGFDPAAVADVAGFADGA